MNAIYLGDIGTDIILDCGMDVSSATVRKIFALNPGRPLAEWPAVAFETNGIKHTLESGDTPVAGTYYLQAYIEMPGFKGYGEVTAFTVKERLA